MHSQRVLITGCGGELGSLVTSMFEDAPWVESILGVDADPPRRRLRRTDFRRVALNNTGKVSDVIIDYDPHIIVHVGVWEPNARLGTAEAERTTTSMGRAVFDAAHQSPSLRAVVIRSGLEVYGARSHDPFQPNEFSPTEPRSTFGRMLQLLEDQAADLRGARGVTVATLRLASVLGPHVPSPLGRLLRLPAVPFSFPKNPSFTVIEDHDAASAFLLAAEHQFDGVVNVVAEGTINMRNTALQGRRIPVPVIGPGLWGARHIANFAGAPVPDHITELLQNGRLAYSSDAARAIRFAPRHTADEVIERLFEWPSVIRVPPARKVA